MATNTITSSASTADEYYYKHTNDQVSKQTNQAQIDQDADEYFELQPIEKKLCAYSLGLGIVLMIIFIITFEVL
ncbi:hypothetical protein [uncultured Megasphaera sp.]|uniref:hypothetical protein n=1 Tax=uncultured Megasphaera sp. TaxID=165188 RepID=UPI002658507C|nr:hypothetical protein [uncultured Megasphaera sp.]